MGLLPNLPVIRPVGLNKKGIYTKLDILGIVNLSKTNKLHRTG